MWIGFGIVKAQVVENVRVVKCHTLTDVCAINTVQIVYLKNLTMTKIKLFYIRHWGLYDYTKRNADWYWVRGTKTNTGTCKKCNSLSRLCECHDLCIGCLNEEYCYEK